MGRRKGLKRPRRSSPLAGLQELPDTETRTRRFAVPIILGAFLLFHVQPIMGRFILPWFGGSAAAWSACLLFFQVGLLAGYAYAYGLTRWLPPRFQGWVDLALMAGTLLFLPIIPADAWKPNPSGSPVGQLLLVLAGTVGLPYFLAASTSPLLQHWLAWSTGGRSPYRLFAASNAAALLGIVSYPAVIEPALGLRAQAVAWSALYAAFVATRGWCAVRVILAGRPAGSREPVQDRSEPEELASRPTPERIVLWVALPAAASAMLLATTNQLSQEVASFPFLWVFPLSLYLLSFVICFDHERWYDRRVFAPLLVVMVPLVIAVQVIGTGVPFWTQLWIYGGTLFATCMVCHGELVRAKPAPRWLTTFYLAVAVGGALGGVGVALVAPAVFRGFWEFPITLVLCVLLALFAPASAPDRPSPTVKDLLRSYALVAGALGLALLGATRTGLVAFWRGGGTFSLLAIGCAGVFAVTLVLDWRRSRRDRSPVWYQYGLYLGVLGLTAAVLLLMADFQSASIHTERNFYGVLRVREAEERILGRFRLLTHGLTQHGIQYTSAELRRLPTTYYGPESGIGLALTRHARRLSPDSAASSLRVGVVGLGVGTLAAYGRPGDVLRFYEIDPAVVRVARQYFAYLEDTRAEVEVVLGDARLRLEDELARGDVQRFDVLAVDAFLGDAIPVHLLTMECVAVYREHLREGGLLAVHISNRLLDFRPVMDALAIRFGLRVAEIRSSGSLAKGTRNATWVVLGDPGNPFFADGVVARAAAVADVERRTGAAHPAPRLWTDDYTSLWPLLRARP